MSSVDNQQPSLLTEEGSEIKDNNSNVIIERLTTKKRTAWNKGLTKSTDERVAKSAKTLLGKPCSTEKLTNLQYQYPIVLQVPVFRVKAAKWVGG